MIKSFRKSAASLFTFLFTILFLSCTFIHETKSGRITFSTSKLLQSSARAAGNISNSDFLEVKIFGDYTDSKTISIGDNSPVIFDEVPIDAKVYAEVYIYKLTALQKRYDTYSGKSEELVVKEGDNILNVILKPIEKEVTTSTYAVIHKYQNVDDDEYTVDTDETEKIEGETSQLTKAQAKSKEGFTAKAFEQKTIQADGSTTVEIYYDRNLHTVTYRAETDDVTDIPDAVQYRYGAPVYINFDSKISRPGYELDGWVTADGNLYKIDGVEYFYMGDEDVTFTAHWAASSDTRYTVKHLQQNIYDDNYTLVETENLRGTSLEYTKAEAKNYPGFTVTYAIAQKPIAEDGSTVIEIKYDRKTACIYYQDGVEAETLDVPVDATIYRYGAEIKIDFSNIGKRNGYTFSSWKDKINDSLFIQDKTEIVTIGTEDITLYAQWTANTYNITYDLNSGLWADSYEAPKTYTYGERQNLPGADKVTRTGYGLTGWYTENGTLLTEIPADMTGDIKLIAQWTAGATRYTVRHWQQNIDNDEYTEIKDDAQILTGISDTSTEAKPNSYTGFTTRENIEQKNISSDGTTVINIYYDRITASIIYDDGVDDETISLPSSNKYRYGANVELDFSTSIVRTGYDFTGWLASDGSIYKNGGTTSLTMGITDIILTAQWAPSSNTKYTVIHLQQNVDDDDYTESETETLYGTSLEQTEAKAKSYTGFEAKSVNQESIKADGSTVIEIYYDREIYSVTYNDGLSDENISSKEYRYGANVEIDFTTSISRTGYNFAGWKTKSGTLYTVDGTSSFKMGTSDVVLTAQWIAASDIKYTVRHMQQNIDNDEYTEIESETLEGTSLEQTKATAKTYSGFTAQSVSQTTINPDGTSVVEIKYDRKTAHLYYQDGVDGSIEVPADAIYRYGATIKLDFTNIGKRTGYTFSHWKDTTNDSDFVPGDSETITIGTDDITLYAQWTANIYNITYDLNNGSWAADYIAASTYTYGLRQNLPGADKVLRSGYGLAGWYTENGTLLSEISADMTGDIKLIAQWTAGASTYTVRHWQQDIDNNEYIEIKDDAQVQTGISEADTAAKANSYKGFIAKDFEQKSIASDGSTVIDIYYDRITNSIIYEDGLADEEISIPESKQYRYGASATIDFTTPVTRPGYDFVGWQTSDGTIYKSDGITSITMGETNITLTAMWTASANTSYTVKHLQQNTEDDNYTEVKDDEENLHGTTGDTTEAKAKDYTGFTALPITQQTIAADGSTIIEVKYNRNEITYTFNSNEGSWADDKNTLSFTGKYGADFDSLLVTEPSRTGYSFDAWDSSIPASYGAEDKVFTAKWNAITYNITYYSAGQNITNTATCEDFPKTYTIEDSKIDLSAYSLKKDGASFIGWYDNEDLSGTALSNIQTSLLKDITLYAKWTYQKTISVTIQSGSWTSDSTTSDFKLTYGSNDLTDGETIKSESGSITLTASLLDGYTYTWKVNGNTTDSSGNKYSSDNTLTLTTTSWKKGIYDISVIATNGSAYQSCFVQIKVGY